MHDRHCRRKNYIRNELSDFVARPSAVVQAVKSTSSRTPALAQWPFERLQDISRTAAWYIFTTFWLFLLFCKAVMYLLGVSLE
jgi:small neutral amino acid transporter SnatA (MarC family)